MNKSLLKEQTHESMRKATSLSKQAILLVHQKRFTDARKMVTEAKEKLQALQEQAKQTPDVVYGGMLSAAYQEYAEANIFLTLVTVERFVEPEEILVPYVDYVLGLADVVGEYRRLALDYLRFGEVEKGEKCLQTMDQIFIQLQALDEAYMLVSGLRHKSDTARKIIEATRGDITIEVRRKALEDQLKRFQLPTKTTQKRKPKKVKT